MGDFFTGKDFRLAIGQSEVVISDGEAVHVAGGRPRVSWPGYC